MAILRTNEHGQKHLVTNTADHDVTGLTGGNILRVNPGVTAVEAFQLAGPSGFMDRGQISVSVASNNLTVALKTLEGNDPSATDPIYIRIGNTVRAVTTATSVTKNANTNWFNSGAANGAATAGLATNAVDYFVFAIWNTTPATDRVDVGFARFPDGITYNDFSGFATTNQRYMAFSGADTPATTDEIAVIGRFTATLSGTAAFNWSISGTGSVVNRPIFETNYLGWSNTLSASGSMTVSGATFTNLFYKIIGSYVFASFDISTITTGGTASSGIRCNLPVVVPSAYNGHFISCGYVSDSGFLGGIQVFNAGYISWSKANGSNFSLAAGKQITGSVYYRHRPSTI